MIAGSRMRYHRRDLRVALEEVTARFTKLRPGAEPVYEANVFVNAVEGFVLVADRR